MESLSKALEEETKPPSDGATADGTVPPTRVSLPSETAAAAATMNPAQQQPCTFPGGGMPVHSQDISFPESQENLTTTGENVISVDAEGSIVVDKEKVTTTVQQGEKSTDDIPVAQNTTTSPPPPQQNNPSFLTLQDDKSPLSSPIESQQPPILPEGEAKAPTQAATAPVETTVSPPLETPEPLVAAMPSKNETVMTTPSPLVATAAEAGGKPQLAADKTTTPVVKESPVATPSSPTTTTTQTTVHEPKHMATKESVSKQQPPPPPQAAVNELNVVDQSSPSTAAKDEETSLVDQSAPDPADKEKSVESANEPNDSVVGAEQGISPSTSSNTTTPDVKTTTNVPTLTTQLQDLTFAAKNYPRQTDLSNPSEPTKPVDATLPTLPNQSLDQDILPPISLTTTGTPDQKQEGGSMAKSGQAEEGVPKEVPVSEETREPNTDVAGGKVDDMETISIEMESEKFRSEPAAAASPPSHPMGEIEAEVARRLRAEEKAIKKLNALRIIQGAAASQPLLNTLEKAVATRRVPKKVTGRDVRSLAMSAGELARGEIEEREKTKAMSVAGAVNPIESMVDNISTADKAQPPKHSVPTPGMSTIEFLMRSAGGRRTKEAHRKTGDDNEMRVVAAELSSLRRTGTAGAPNGESNEDAGAARLLSSWGHEDVSGRKRSSGTPGEERKKPAKRRKSNTAKLNAISPRDSVLPDADAMAQIGEMPPAAQPPTPRAAAAGIPANVGVPPSTPAPQHDKAFLVEQATELVCRALLDGPWPCLTEFSVVVAALHQFASDIIVPALYAADPQPTVAHDTPIILGTLLMLREALILNADSIFGIANGGEQGERLGRDSQGEYFAASTLATSILLAALDSLGGSSASTYAPKFLRIIDAYESGQGDFAQLMVDEEADSSSSVVLCPNGNPMQEDERDAWRASHRWHTQTHPTVIARQHGPGMRPIRPNAVHISVIGEQNQHRGSGRRVARR
eukprot:scaffold37799_cov176-Amphora_coffeaeformis.AAC.1